MIFKLLPTLKDQLVNCEFKNIENVLMIAIFGQKKKFFYLNSCI